MNPLLNINKLLILIVFVLIILLVAGFSYAHFAPRIVDTEDEATIKSSSNVIQINYDGGPKLEIADMEPSTLPFVTKKFTVTGINNTVSFKYNNGYKYILF